MSADSAGPAAHPPGADLVVTYHYVRPTNSDGVTGITVEEFDRQLALIARTHAIVGVDDFLAGRGGARGQPLALITFDDGLLDQYEHALPVLTRRRVPAVFFCPMRPVDPALDPLEAWTPQHLLHALAQKLGWAELESRVRAAIGELEIDEARMNTLYHYEAPAKRWLKYALAFAVPADRSAAILHAINRNRGPRLGAGGWFMSRDQLADLQSRGHSLGAHGYDHLPYSSLSPLDQARDMTSAAALMDRLFGWRPRSLAYPFGRHDATTRELVRLFGYTHAFTTDERVDCKFLEAALAKPVIRTAGAPRERAA